MATKVTVSTIVHAPTEKAWEYFTKPEHVMVWNHASDDWHCPSATADLRPGGAFSSRMEAKDKSIGFDFGGTYDEVIPNEFLSYTIGDGRTVEIGFEDMGDGKTQVTETFEAETQNPVDMQQQGWQAILDNYKKHVESK
ncbi:MAG TPA: SRPBCC family protein [Candidatus Paceibacterota bacterium]|jgi:Uncharacterized conserved protein